jgi:preprotein translocase subunit YajC
MNIAGAADQQIVPNKKGRTFGKQPGALRANPNDYMKSNASTSKVKTLTEIKKSQPHLLQPTELKPKLKPDVPRTSDTPVMNLVTSKNFVVANAVETILAAPKKAQQGAKDYLSKEDYGKVPKYLKNIQQDIEAEYDYIRQLQEQEMQEQQSQMRPLSDDERVQLISGLKAKWEAVNTEYQGQTHLTVLDTTGKIGRKEKYEAELQQIEKDIEKLNRKNIFVHRDS